MESLLALFYFLKNFFLPYPANPINPEPEQHGGGFRDSCWLEEAANFATRECGRVNVQVCGSVRQARRKVASAPATPPCAVTKDGFHVEARVMSNVLS